MLMAVAVWLLVLDAVGEKRSSSYVIAQLSTARGTVIVVWSVVCRCDELITHAFSAECVLNDWFGGT